MDKISGLSDELLVKILLLLPTKAAVSTSILSKRWERLWMWLPKLEFIDSSYSNPERQRLRCFLDRNLPLLKAPIIERLRLKLDDLNFKSEDVKLWIVIAVSRCIRKLEISYSSHRNNLNILPSCLYICKSLVNLKLYGDILLDVPRLVCLPSLKTLQLQRVVFFNEESLQRLLSICPILEDLMVWLADEEVNNMGKFTIIVPSLQRLSLYIPNPDDDDDDFDLQGFVINTPSLKYFKLVDKMEKIHSCLIENMPKLREAYVDVVDEFVDIKNLIRSITSVKSLTLCIKHDGLEAVCGNGFVFDHLEHLKLCVCQKFDLLVQFLNHSPNVRKLDFFRIYEHNLEVVDPWNEQTMAPESILSNLQNFKWSKYYGTEEERNLAVYFLKNARRLKTATFSSNDCCVPKLKMIKELALSSRASTTCQLEFD